MKKPKKVSGLFRRYLIATLSIILVSYIIVGAMLLIFISGMWMNEKLDLLEENTTIITENTSDVLHSDFLSQSSRGAVLMIYNSLSQASSTLEGDFFIVNDKGEVVYCKEMMSNTNMMQDGECLIHSNYSIPDEVMEELESGDNYRATGYLGGQLTKISFTAACPLVVNGSFHGAVFGTMPVSDGLLPYVLGIFRMFMLAAFLTFIFAFLFVYFFTYRMIRPLREMSLAAKQYAVGDFSTRVTVHKTRWGNRHRTEVDELAESFNSMAKELAALELSRRNFVSNVSHELKTPMTTISGFIDGILDGTIDKENQDKYLNIVSEEVKRLSRLVTGMLNMSKIEAGKMKMNPVEFDISEMLFNTLLSFEQVLEKKNVDVRGLDTLGSNKILADKDMINQVVYNLVDNAVKFTPEGGYIEVASKSDPEKIIVKIRNSGMGVEPEEIDKIFERFYKVDKSRSYDVKGAGMGLYIVKTIVELHGGRIEAHSRVGEYTEFIFDLPK